MGLPPSLRCFPGVFAAATGKIAKALSSRLYFVATMLKFKIIKGDGNQRNHRCLNTEVIQIPFSFKGLQVLFVCLFLEQLGGHKRFENCLKAFEKM